MAIAELIRAGLRREMTRLGRIANAMDTPREIALAARIMKTAVARVLATADASVEELENTLTEAKKIR